MIALLLSAGFGKRLGPLTKEIAKPALPLLDLPLIAYPIYYLKQAKIKKLIINTHYKPLTIHNAYKDIKPHMPEIETHFLHEEPDILLGGGAAKNAEAYLKNHKNFIYINADTFFLTKKSDVLSDLINFHNSKKSMATLLTTNHPELCKTYSAVWFDKNNQLKDIGKNSADSSLTPRHFTGVMILSTQVLDSIPKQKPFSIFKALLPLAKKKQIVNSFYCENMDWFELGDCNNFLNTEAHCINLLQKDNSYQSERLKDILSSYK